jgi:hypothetical protein
MAATRLWVLIASAVLVLMTALSLARAAGDSAPGDFLVLAIKPEGEVKDYRLIPVGESGVDPVQYRDVVNSLPRSLFGGVMVRPYDERAELAQCRTACAANAKCGNFTYVRPGKDRPVGVCHLRRAVEAPAASVAEAPVPPAAVPAPVVSMPVVENAAPQPEVVVVSPTVRNTRKLLAVDTSRNGREIYKPAQAPATPMTFKFKMPVSTAKAYVVADGNRRVWANVEALDAKGRVFKRSGTWIAADGAAHQLLVRTNADRIAALRISTREEGALIAQSVDFIRSTPEPAVVAEADPVEFAQEDVPAPMVPDAEAVVLALPPRVATTEPPQDVADAAVEETAPAETVVAELPAVETPMTVTPIPIAPPVASPPAPPPPAAPQALLPGDDELSILAAAGATVLGLGGFGLYRRSYRRRQLGRLLTNVVSDGLDQHTVLITADERPDMSLRYTVRMPAEVSARTTTVVIIPEGIAA